MSQHRVPVFCAQLRHPCALSWTWGGCASLGWSWEAAGAGSLRAPPPPALHPTKPGRQQRPLGAVGGTAAGGTCVGRGDTPPLPTPHPGLPGACIHTQLSVLSQEPSQDLSRVVFFLLLFFWQSVFFSLGLIVILLRHLSYKGRIPKTPPHHRLFR